MYKKCSKSLFYIELSVKILKSFIKCATQTLSYQRLQEYLWWIKHVFYCVSGSSSSRSSTQTYRLRLAPLYPIFQSLFFCHSISLFILFPPNTLLCLQTCAFYFFFKLSLSSSSKPVIPSPLI